MVARGAAKNPNKGKKACPKCGKLIAARANACSFDCDWKREAKVWSDNVRKLARDLVYAALSEGDIYDLFPLLRKEALKVKKYATMKDDEKEELLKFLTAAVKKT